MIHQNRKDLPRDNPLDRVEVLRYDEKRRKVRKGRVPTETGLGLEQTQQGSSNEVSVSTEGVEEWKRIEMWKGWKEIALHLFNLRAESGFNTYATSCYKDNTSIEDKTSWTQWRTALNFLATQVLLKELVSISRGTLHNVSTAHCELCWYLIRRRLPSLQERIKTHYWV